MLKDTITEMAPLTRADALRMISSIKGASVLDGTRGRQRADTDALALLLVALGDFAIANSGGFTALDVNPIIVKAEGEGAVAVDVVLELERTGEPHCSRAEALSPMRGQRAAST